MEQRKNPRKIVKVKAVLAMDGREPELTRTVDIAIEGVSLTVSHPLQAGQLGQVSFDLLVDGRPVPVKARCKVIHCIFSGGEFKTGLQFVNLDPTTMTQIGRFMR